MADSDGDMAVFMAVFERTTRQGPGSAASTKAMFDAIPAGERLDRILEIGCGKGVTSLLLARWTGGTVTATDIHQPFLDHLATEAARQGLGDRVRPVNKDMAALDFPDGTFDLLWAEGSVYNLGVEKALSAWRPLLRPRGWLFLNDAVWTTPTPDPACRAFWEAEYPAIGTLEARAAQAVAAGYEVVATQILPRADWDAYTADMEAQTVWAEEAYGPSDVTAALRHEADIQRRFGDQYSYGGLLLRRAD